MAGGGVEGVEVLRRSRHLGAGASLVTSAWRTGHPQQGGLQDQDRWERGRDGAQGAHHAQGLHAEGRRRLLRGVRANGDVQDPSPGLVSGGSTGPGGGPDGRALGLPARRSGRRCVHGDSRCVSRRKGAPRLQAEEGPVRPEAGAAQLAPGHQGLSDTATWATPRLSATRACSSSAAEAAG